MKTRTQILALAAVVGLTTMAQAAVTDELAGNLFHQNGAALDSNISLAVNNPQNMGGGSWVGGSTANYPVSSASPILDGNLTTGWNAGNFSGGGMLNFAITKGSYDSASTQSFTAVPFGNGIGQIRIWASDQWNWDNTWWIHLPQQVAVAYTTTTNFASGPYWNTINNGGSYNSDTLGVLPGIWNTPVTIASINGAAPSASSNSAYATSNGWADLSSAWAYTTPQTFQSGSQGLAYVDLSVSLPADATSVMISFGQTTNSPGGVSVIDVQATAVPEPVAMSLLGTAGAALLVRRRVA